MFLHTRGICNIPEHSSQKCSLFITPNEVQLQAEDYSCTCRQDIEQSFSIALMIKKSNNITQEHQHERKMERGANGGLTLYAFAT